MTNGTTEPAGHCLRLQQPSLPLQGQLAQGDCFRKTAETHSCILSAFRQGSSHTMVPQYNQSGAEEGRDLVISTSGFHAHCGSLQCTSVVISHYSMASGNTSLRYAHLPSNTGRCQHPCVWQHALTWIRGKPGG